MELKLSGLEPEEDMRSEKLFLLRAEELDYSDNFTAEQKLIFSIIWRGLRDLASAPARRRIRRRGIDLYNPIVWFTDKGTHPFSFLWAAEACDMQPHTIDRIIAAAKNPESIRTIPPTSIRLTSHPFRDGKDSRREILGF